LWLKTNWFVEGDAPTDLNTIVFRLQTTCHTNPKAHNQSVDPKDQFINSSVYSESIKFIPQGDQLETFGNSGIGVVNNNILVAKLRPKQQLDLELHAVKGVGKDHAKFSPVCTVSYRLLPDIQILQPIVGRDAQKFVSCFPPGVAEVFKNGKGEMEARIVDARKDTMSREVLRHPEFEDKVRLTRVRDHFICKSLFFAKLISQLQWSRRDACQPLTL
jgi:DNA-directed RNA polymerase I and III subunit RPAC1